MKRCLRNKHHPQAFHLLTMGGAANADDRNKVVKSIRVKWGVGSLRSDDEQQGGDHLEWTSMSLLLHWWPPLRSPTLFFSSNSFFPNCLYKNVVAPL